MNPLRGSIKLCYTGSSDETNGLKPVYELPLFPLHTVLFPGMPLRLHIFEERYKQMIADCRRSGEGFGVALIRSGDEVGGGAEPFEIGCTAAITQIELLADGRMNIAVVGQERFLIHSTHQHRPYLIGLVETYPLVNPAPERLDEPGQALRVWVQRYLDVLSKAAEIPLDMQQLPTDPLRLAYLASFVLQIPMPQKQELLAIERADDLLRQLRALYRREVTLLQVMTTKDEAPITGPFSAN
ncbi:MAG: LON peptidase substrate-binding domain-containing protein [Chloroflexi bacterium]|nr:LON peptidase substrate-binding domain-containing protein [Chloroflexota bacterium]